MEIRVSIVSYNNAETIEKCLASIPAQVEGLAVKISVLDNASTDATVATIKENYPEVDLIESAENLGFGAGHNQIFRQSGEELLLVLNPDAWLMDGAFELLLAEMLSNKDLALVAPRIDYVNGAPQLSFGKLPSFFADLQQKRMTQDLRLGHPSAQFLMERRLRHAIFPAWVSGACFLARRQALEAVDYFDQRFFLYMEDVDLCNRLRMAGWQILLQPAARCRHSEGHSHAESSDSRPHFRRSRLIYLNKYASKIAFMIYKTVRARDIDLEYDPALRTM
jgi:N-acetylglucosaminyl-diphospho-decaprenol L-rhamnosyltransferase